MEDYTKYFRYPTTPYAQANSHAEYLKQVTLRNQIAVAIHGFGVEQLQALLTAIQDNNGK